MDDNTAPALRCLRSVFSSFAGSESANARDAAQDTDEAQHEMDIAAWHKLCAECALADSMLERSQQLESMFHDAATNGRVKFEGFCDLMRQIAKAQYMSADPLSDFIRAKLATFLPREAMGSHTPSKSVSDTSEPHETPPGSPSSSGSHSISEKSGISSSAHLPDRNSLSFRVTVPELQLAQIESKSAPTVAHAPPFPLMKTASSGSFLQPDFEHPLLDHHREMTKDCAPLYHAAQSLLFLFSHYCSSINDGVELQNFQQMCREIGLVPAPLTYSQVRSQFRLICAANEAEGSGGITLTYTGLVMCLRGCGELAFGDAADASQADKELAKLLREGATKVRERNETKEEWNDAPSLSGRETSNLSMDTDCPSSVHRADTDRTSSVQRADLERASSVARAESPTGRHGNAVGREGSSSSRRAAVASEESCGSKPGYSRNLWLVDAEESFGRSFRSVRSFDLPAETPRSAGAPSPRGRRPGAEEEPGTALEEQLQQLAREQQQALDILASDCSARAIQLRRDRDAASGELEAELAAKMAEVGAREHAMRARHKPKRAELELRAQLEAIDRAEAAVVEEGEREHVLKQLRAVESLEEQRHLAAVKKEFELVHNRVRDACDRARQRFSAETQAMEEAMQAEMQCEYDKIRIRFDTRRKQAQEQHQLRCQGISNTELPDLASVRKKTSRSSPTTPRVRERSGCDMTGGSSSGWCGASTRSLRRGDLSLPRFAGQACEELSELLRQIFDTVLEAFVFLDANDDGVLDRGELQRQLHRIGVDVSVDQLLLETGAQGRLPTLRMQEFAKAVAWHVLPQWGADLEREYARARTQRARAVGKLHEWQARTQRSPSPPPRSVPNALSDPAAPWMPSAPSVVVHAKANRSRLTADVGELASAVQPVPAHEATTGKSRSRSEPRAPHANREQPQEEAPLGERERSQEATSQERGRTRNRQPYLGGMQGTWRDDERKRMLDEKKRLEIALIEAQKELRMVERKQRVADNFLGMGAVPKHGRDVSDGRTSKQGAGEEWKHTAFGKLRVVKSPKRKPTKEAQSGASNGELALRSEGKKKNKQGSQYQWVDPFGTVRVVDVKTPRAGKSKPTRTASTRKRTASPLAGTKRSESQNASLSVQDLASASRLAASTDDARPSHLPHHYQEWSVTMDDPRAADAAHDAFGLIESDENEEEGSARKMGTPRRRAKGVAQRAELLPHPRAEFVGPMGKYDDKMNPLWSQLDHWDSRIWQKCETRTGLWPRAPPGLRPEPPDPAYRPMRWAGPAAWESSSKRTREWVRAASADHLHALAPAPSPPPHRQQAVRQHRTASPRQRAPRHGHDSARRQQPQPAPPAEPEMLIDECLELMADILNESSRKTSRRRRTDGERGASRVDSSVRWSPEVSDWYSSGVELQGWEAYSAANHKSRGGQRPAGSSGSVERDLRGQSGAETCSSSGTRRGRAVDMTEEEAAINARYHVLEPSGWDSAGGGDGLFSREQVAGKAGWVELRLGDGEERDRREQRGEWLREQLKTDSQTESESDEEVRKARWWRSWSGGSLSSGSGRLPEPFELASTRNPSRSSPSPRLSLRSPEARGVAAANSISPRPRPRSGCRGDGRLSARARVLSSRTVDQFVRDLKSGLRGSDGSDSDAPP